MVLLGLLLLTSAIAHVSDYSEKGVFRYPAVRGDRVIFTHASDLWSWDRKGGKAVRLTSHPNMESRAEISPDGSQIAFTASFEGNNDVYVMPIGGGEPKRLTYEPQADNVLGWTPDGRIAYSSTYGSHMTSQPRLWLVSPRGGLPQETPVLEANDASFSPDGSKVAYYREPGVQMNWRQYRGGQQARISIYDLRSNEYSELPSGRENSFNPMWVGTSIYYLSDKDNNAVNLFRYDLDSKRSERLTNFTDGFIRSTSTDGKTIVLERDGALVAYDIASKAVSSLDPVISENVALQPTLKKLGGSISALSVSPSGDRIAVEARGELFDLPATTGEAKNLTASSGVRERSPVWSPDGKWIAYSGDQSGERELYLLPSTGGQAIQITSGQGPNIARIKWANDSKSVVYSTSTNGLKIVDIDSKKLSPVAKVRGELSFDLSPDGKWLAFTDALSNGNDAVFLYNLVKGTKHQITDSAFDHGPVAFDSAGRYLYTLASRVIVPNDAGSGYDVDSAAFRKGVYAILLTSDQPSPTNDDTSASPAPTRDKFSIDLDGLASRVVQLPFPAGNYDSITSIQGGVMAISEQGALIYKVGEAAVSNIFSGSLDAFSVNADGTKLGYLSSGTLGLVDIKPGQKPGDGKISTAGIEATIDPQQEWRQVYWDAWRYERDHFIEPNMRGVNWRAIGDRYAARLPYLTRRSDLTLLLSMMISELWTSHAAVFEGDPWISQPGVPVGLLGADYEADHGKIRFKRLYRGTLSGTARGPLSEPGVSIAEGDYLLEIDGQPLTDATSPSQFLVNKAGRWVTLTVNSSPSLEGSRSVRVKTIGNDTNLRYYEWAEHNRRYVEKASKGRIGYLHLPDMLAGGATAFVAGYYQGSDKEALIIDERNNRGGSDPSHFVETLQRTALISTANRQGRTTLLPRQAVSGPKALLINGYSMSSADLFAYLFRKAKIGPLIGRRTWGGAIGTTSTYQLADGGAIAAPSLGFFDPHTGKWIAENEGIWPDIDVDLRPDLLAQGRDTQLDAAVNYLLKEIDKRKPLKVKPPQLKRIGG
jgi:tricorn protease